MRRTIPLTLAALAALSAGAAPAAEVSQRTAGEIERSLTRYLPPELARAGLLTVQAATTFYELRVDPAVLAAKARAGGLAVEGLKPVTAYLRPAQDGTYRVEAATDLDLKGSFGAGAGKGSFSYLVEAMKLDGIYDPEILYFRAADWTAKGLAFESRSPQQSVEARFGESAMRVAAETTGAGLLDISGTGVLKAFTETVTGGEQGRVEISADVVDVDVGLDGARYQVFRDLVFFVLDNMQKKTLEPAEAARFKALLRAALPVFDNLTETITASNVTVGTAQGTFGARSVRYDIAMNGIAHATRVGFGFDIDGPRPPAGLLPAAFEGVVPERATFRAAVTDLDLAGAMTYLLDRTDFSRPLTDEESREAGRIVLPTGTMNVAFEDVSAVSAIYDVRLTGRMRVQPGKKDGHSADVTITARDFDKTVAYLQQNAAAVPQFGQAAFMLLMVKGFAKDLGNGTQSWDIAVGEDGKVLINGRPLPFQPQ
ncbi:hypothetical protein [Shinella pollutisoli]|uniref:DUF2125 domain-containing protein n=1 Tax=Shinella pollutisoli TaxID=2250594 RepID=A0ABV7DP10_9HYPH|nr:hypothetical protein [Shinella pollutisoli]